MKKIIKKITVMAVMSLFAATQLQIPQVNVQAADGVATAEKTTAKQPKIYGRSGIVIDAKSGGYLFLQSIKAMNFAKIQEQGFIPLYKREAITDALHEVSGFRTKKINRKYLRLILCIF